MSKEELKERRIERNHEGRINVVLSSRVTSNVNLIHHQMVGRCSLKMIHEKWRF